MENENGNYFGTKHFLQQHAAAGNGRSPDRGNESIEKEVDLNDYLVRNRPATFFMRVTSEAMVQAGIYYGDTVVIDRSIQAINGKVVIAMLNGEMLIRRFEKTFNKIRLVPATDKLSPIDVDATCEDFSIWGVVTFVIHEL